MGYPGNENGTFLLGNNTSLPMEDLQLILSHGMESAKVKDMLAMAKRNYVLSHHTRKIFQMAPSKSWKNGCYKTYIYVDSGRKEITASTEEKLIEKLYKFYWEADKKVRCLSNVFDLYMDYKKYCLDRCDHTIEADRNLFKNISQKLLETDVNDISDEDIQKFIVSDLLPKNPKQNTFNRILQLLRAVFDYGIRRKICFENPMKYIVAQDYYKHCDPKIKTDEEKAFSLEELDRLSMDAGDNLNNPRVLIALMAMETGMRAGELVAFHVEDVLDEYLHVHRQQVTIKSEKGLDYVEVLYTKEERLHPNNGRYIPITDEIRRIIELARAIPGESPYLFHDVGESGMIKKDSYELNLRRRCKKLGCVPTNNHAFRMAFNSKLIEMGFSSADRALILGHNVQTNEAHYSLTDKRRLDRIKRRLNKEEP